MPHNATASARHSNHVNRGHKDHLAKRFYDMAAETSVDAKVPVALALAKLALVFAVKNVEDLKILIGKILALVLE